MLEFNVALFNTFQSDCACVEQSAECVCVCVCVLHKLYGNIKTNLCVCVCVSVCVFVFVFCFFGIGWVGVFFGRGVCVGGRGGGGRGKFWFL